MPYRAPLTALAFVLLGVWFAACAPLPGALGDNSGDADAGSMPVPDDDDDAGSVDSGPGFAPASGPHPEFGATQTQAVSPPPVSGGTLLVLHDGRTAVAADPDRDVLYVVDLVGPSATFTIALKKGDEPGRLVEDGAGGVHVALRSGGAVVDIDPKLGVVSSRRDVCPEPRGIAYDTARDALYVACAGGELVTLPTSGPITRTVRLAPDLRDVVIAAGQLYVSSFRSATLLAIAPDGTVSARISPPMTEAFDLTKMVPSVAWRTVNLGTGVLMVHQRHKNANLGGGTPVYYQAPRGSCNTSVVESALTTFSGYSNVRAAATLSSVVLPVDVAVSADGQSFAVASAGNGKTAALPGVVILDATAYATTTGCTTDTSDAGGSVIEAAPAGQVTAVAFDGQGRVIAQTREPAALFVLTPTLGTKKLAISAPLPLSTISREDTGHSIFHSNSGGFIACASCHAEGRDDGHVWDASKAGPRRTQSLRGTLAGTAPYHWEGDLVDLPALEHELFEQKMGGAMLATDQANALASWLLALPAPRTSPPIDAAAAARGASLFADPSVGCSSCHNGAKYTSNATVDVGTGGPFQVPSLVGVSWRAPFLHGGCATTFAKRFEPTCGGATHGHTSQLAPSQVQDLIAYLETL